MAPIERSSDNVLYPTAEQYRQQCVRLADERDEARAEVERQAKQLERLRGMGAHAMAALEADLYGEAWAALNAATKDDDDE